MRILGIDPGLAIVGYGVVELNGNNFKPIDYGCILTNKDMDFPYRLKYIYESMNQLIDKYRPDEVAIEELFFNKNVKTAIAVGQARGVEVLSVINNGLDIYEYTPLQIKQAVTGYGRAEKVQVQEMVKMLLSLKKLPKPDDAADALAVALCHGFSINFKEEFKMR